MTKDEELRCEKVLEAAFHGLHHIPGEIKKGPYFWSVNTYGGIATHDFDMLTLLVFAAHDQCVRVDITQGGPRMVKIILHPRRCRNGGMSARHPTLEAKLKEWRDLGHESVPMPEKAVEV